MVGGEVVRRALLDPAVQQVTALVRRPLAFQHPRLRVVLHHDFLDYSALTMLFRQHDACLWCLGISQTQVTSADYDRITYDYAVAAATAIAYANPAMTFLFLSGQGADSAERSPIRFARVKGRTENALRRLPLGRLVIARPGAILPVRPKATHSLADRLVAPFLPLLRRLPALAIGADELAQVLVRLVQNPHTPLVLSHWALQALRPRSVPEPALALRLSPVVVGWRATRPGSTDRDR